MTRKWFSFPLVVVILFSTVAFGWAAGGTSVPHIELMEPGWVNQPTDKNDPFRKYLNETYGVDITLNNTAEFYSQVLTRFASGDAPDIISFDANATGESALRQLYQEGFLVKDWYAYKAKLPGWMKYMDDNAEQYFTIDKRLICLSPKGDPAIWGFQIRKDWLTKLGLKVPATPEQLLDVARAFTKKDPDGNGKADTYGFTSAGAGTGVGEINYLRLMWGPNNFYIKDGKVAHYVTDGTEKAFLDYMRILVQEGLIQPDWYTVKWQDRKAPLFQGKLGTAWYPGVLVTEFVTEGNVPVADAMKMWTHLPMPKGSTQGGKLYPSSFFPSMNTVSVTAEKDKAKFSRIIALLEGICYPNPGYDKLRWGVDIDQGKVVSLGGGAKAILAGPDEKRYRSSTNFLGAADWGKWMSTRADNTIMTTGTSEKDIPQYAYGEIELNNGALKESTYKPDALFLHLDQTVLGELNTLLDEFEYKYIMKETDDYDGFVKQWINAGGQQLLDEAKAQFKKLGKL